MSLLLIWFKIFEKLIFGSIYEFFNKNNLFNNNLMTLAYIIFLPLHMTFSLFLMLTFHWKFVVFFLIYQKDLIDFGMMVFFINSRVMELTLTSLNSLNRFYTADVNGLFSMVNHQSGNQLQLVHGKVQF